MTLPPLEAAGGLPRRERHAAAALTLAVSVAPSGFLFDPELLIAVIPAALLTFVLTPPYMRLAPKWLYEEAE